MSLRAAGSPCLRQIFRYHILLNGEIYNYLELRVELESRGHSFKTSSDTEVLLHGFAEWGRGVLSRLVGMFAIALLDVETRTLLLARDFFGIKPLLYTNSPAGFAFGSWIRSLIEATRMQLRADPTSVFQFLRFGLTDDTGQTRCVQGVGICPLLTTWKSRFESPASATRTVLEIPFGDPQDISFEAAAAQVRDAFLRSVELHSGVTCQSAPRSQVAWTAHPS